MISISRNKLKAASRFMAHDDVRYYLNGLLLESNATQTRVVATNGHTLFAAYDSAEDQIEFSGIVPDTAIKQILGWKGKGDMPVVFTVNPAGEQRACWNGNTAVFQLIEGTFPDYTRILPTALSGEAAFYDPEYLMWCSKAAADLGGPFAFKQNGDSPGIAVFSPQAFAVVMPMRNGVADVESLAWARAPARPKLQAVA